MLPDMRNITYQVVTLQAGDTDTLSIWGHALVGGEAKLKFHVHGDVDLDYLKNLGGKGQKTALS